MGLTPMSSDPILQKQMQAYYTTSQLSRGMMESVEDYNKRIQKYREELAEKIKEENTQILQNKLLGIDPKISTNMQDLKNANSQIDSLKFWQFVLGQYDKGTIDDQITKLKNQQNLIQQKIAELQKGKNEKENLNLYEQNAFDFPSAEKKAAGMFDNDTMATGKRNILS